MTVGATQRNVEWRRRQLGTFRSLPWAELIPRTRSRTSAGEVSRRFGFPRGVGVSQPLEGFPGYRDLHVERAKVG